MASMHFERAYTLAEDDARARLRALSDYWTKKHGIEIRWEGDTVHLAGNKLGVKFSGSVRLGGGRLVADVETNWMAKKLGALDYVERKLDHYLDPAVALAELQAKVPS